MSHDHTDSSSDFSFSLFRGHLKRNSYIFWWLSSVLNWLCKLLAHLLNVIFVHSHLVLSDIRINYIVIELKRIFGRQRIVNRTVFWFNHITLSWTSSVFKFVILFLYIIVLEYVSMIKFSILLANEPLNWRSMSLIVILVIKLINNSIKAFNVRILFSFFCVNSIEFFLDLGGCFVNFHVSLNSHRWWGQFLRLLTLSHGLLLSLHFLKLQFGSLLFELRSIFKL